MRHVKYGRCVKCGKTYEAVPDLTTCEGGGILDIVYDYDYIKSVFTKETLKNRQNFTMWRYRELLPVEDTTPDPPLRVGWSPLYAADRLAEQLGIRFADAGKWDIPLAYDGVHFTEQGHRAFAAGLLEELK